MAFLFLCSLVAEVKTSNTMLNNSGESGHPCLVPDLRGKALSFSPLRMILAFGSFIYGFYDLEACSFYPYFLEGFLSRKDAIWGAWVAQSVKRPTSARSRSRGP